MKKRGRIAVAFLIAASLYGYAPLAEAQAPLRCGPFMQGELSPPTPRQNGHARARFDQINTAVKAQPHRVLFLGDSLTEGFDHEVWEQHMAPRRVLSMPGSAATAPTICGGGWSTAISMARHRKGSCC